MPRGGNVARRAPGAWSLRQGRATKESGVRMYTPQCPRCGRKIGPHELYCKKCARDMRRPLGSPEPRRGSHLLYTFALVLANLALLFYLFWRSYM